MNITSRRLNKTALAIALILGALTESAQALDLNKPEDSYKAMLRVVGDISGKATFKDWDVVILAALPGEKPRPILRTIGFNAGRMLKQADGSYHWVTREVSYYVDLQSGQIIENWVNPLNGKSVDVVHVANDPVSNKFPRFEAGKPNPMADFNKFDVRGDVSWMHWDLPLKYPNALKPAAHPEESTGENYVASEHFIWFANTTDLQSDTDTTTPTHYAWFRNGPWLPWMKMGMTPGHLIYSGNGRKYGSFDALSQQLREYTLKHFPKFADAPDSFYQPNETSWSYYRKLKEAGALPGPGNKPAKK